MGRNLVAILTLLRVVLEMGFVAVKNALIIGEEVKNSKLALP